MSYTVLTAPPTWMRGITALITESLDKFSYVENVWDALVDSLEFFLSGVSVYSFYYRCITIIYIRL